MTMHRCCDKELEKDQHRLPSPLRQLIPSRPMNTTRMRWIRLSCLLLLSSTSLLAWTPDPPPPSPARRQRWSRVLLRAQVDPNPKEMFDRRDLLGVTVIAVLSGYLSPAKALAAAPATPAEAIRRFAANIPGYGPTDVFFPGNWIGQWRVQRQVSFDGNSENTLNLDYTTRFLPSVEDGTVVVDRGFTQANLEGAATSFQSATPSYQWTYTNPNNLSLTWPDGRRKDIKVTQRATDYHQVGEGRLWSSEVHRVAIDGGGISDSSSVPVVTARRVVIQYRWEPNNEDKSVPKIVQAMEVIYDLGSSDPLQSSRSGGAGKNAILSKSRILMQKVEVNK